MGGWLTKLEPSRSWSREVMKEGEKGRGGTEGSQVKGVVMKGGHLKALQQPSIQGLTTRRCYWGFVTHWWCLLPRGLKQRKVHVCSNLLTTFVVCFGGDVLTFSVQPVLNSIFASK